MRKSLGLWGRRTTPKPGKGVRRNSCTRTIVTAGGTLVVPLSVIVTVAIFVLGWVSFWMDGHFGLSVGVKGSRLVLVFALENS
eukprot:m.191234 g.191234  ORF g.191234 m.191234 type:complete len:83 (+) comp39442_c0_seq7:192-440(+)